MKTHLETILYIVVSILVCCPSAFAQQQVNEISVTGMAHATIEPDSVLITLQALSEGKTASEAFAVATGSRQSLLNSLNKENFSTSFHARGRKVTGPNNGPVTPGGIVYLKDIFVIELDAITSLEKVLDAALAANCHVLNVEFQAKNIESTKNDLLMTATANAQNKAELLASKLGVKVGQLLSAGVTEEPQGEFIRQARQIGASQLDVMQRPMKYFVSLRYGVK